MMKPPPLSPPQRAAVEAPAGAFVDAGAGSGKTTVLVERYVRSVTLRNHLPSQVLAVTFTTRAAGEMRERIRARLRGEGRADLIPLVEAGWIGTIHAACRRILAEFPDRAGLTQGLRVADPVETALLRDGAFDRAVQDTLSELGDPGLHLLAAYGAERLREIATTLLLGARIRGREPEAPVGAGSAADLAAAVDALRVGAEAMKASEGASDQAVLRRQAAIDLLDQLDREPIALELADLGAYMRGDAAYKRLLEEVEFAARDVIADALAEPLQFLLNRYAEVYEEAKREAGAVDNDDLQLRTRRLLEEHADVRATLQERFREIMVDEYQDTDSLQSAIVALLRGPQVPLLAVGDEQQAIYGFRGAEVGVFRAAREQAGASVVPLVDNRRSVPPVLDAVNALFAREPRFEHRPLVPVREHPGGDDPRVEFLIGAGDSLAEGREAEATLVAARLREIVDAGACRPGQVAIVFRAGTRAQVFERALRAVGLPTVSSTGRGFLDRQPVGDVLAMLRVLWNRYDDLAMLTCLASPMAGVSNDGLALMRASVEWEFADALESLSSIGLKNDDLARATALRDAIGRLRPLVGRLALGDLVAAIVAETRYDLAALTLEDGPERLANLDKLQRIARAFEAARGADLPGFVAAVESGRLDRELRTEGLIASEDADAVRLMTVHQAKGLEFPVVVVADTGSKPPPEVRPALVPPTGLPAAVVPASTGARCPTRALQSALDEAKEAAAREAHRVMYVACTRAEERLIITGARSASAAPGSTLRWLLELLGDDGEEGDRIVDLDDTAVRVRVERDPIGAELWAPGRDETIEFTLDGEGGQLALDVEGLAASAPGATHGLPTLSEVPGLGAWAPPMLSYSALDLHARCAYRFHVQRMLGVPAAQAGGSAPIGKAVHEAVETGGDAGVLLAGHDPAATEAECAEARAAAERWRRSPLGMRFATLDGVRHEQPFLLHVGGASITGRYDLTARTDAGLMIGDLKVGALKGLTPDERRDAGYLVQEAVYALAALEAGNARVEVAFQWVGDDEAATAMAVRTFEASERDVLRAGLEQRVAAALRGPWPPTPAPTVCQGCPALGMLCAGPDLGTG